MSLKLQSFAGTIRIEPRPSSRAAGDCDDSTLDRLLASFAHREVLDDGYLPARNSIRLIAAGRLSWSASSHDDVALRANLVQLLCDLQAELDQFDGVAS